MSHRATSTSTSRQLSPALARPSSWAAAAVLALLLAAASMNLASGGWVICSDASRESIRD